MTFAHMSSGHTQVLSPAMKCKNEHIPLKCLQLQWQSDSLNTTFIRRAINLKWEHKKWCHWHSFWRERNEMNSNCRFRKHAFVSEQYLVYFYWSSRCQVFTDIHIIIKLKHWLNLNLQKVPAEPSRIMYICHMYIILEKLNCFWIGGE